MFRLGAARTTDIAMLYASSHTPASGAQANLASLRKSSRSWATPAARLRSCATVRITWRERANMTNQFARIYEYRIDAPGRPEHGRVVQFDGRTCPALHQREPYQLADGV